MSLKPRRFSRGRLSRRWRRATFIFGSLLIAGTVTLSGAGATPPARAFPTEAQEASALQRGTIASPFAFEDDLEFETGPETPEPIEFVVAPQDADLSFPDEQLRVQILIRNPRTEELPAGRITITLSSNPVDVSVPDSEQTLEDLPNLATSTVIAEEGIPATTADGEQTLTVSVAVSDLPNDFVDAQPGVYQIHAYLRTGDNASTAPNAGLPNAEATPNAEADSLSQAITSTRTLISSTRIVWRGGQLGSTIPLTTVVPLVLPRAIETMPALTDMAALGSRFDALLTSAERSRATLAIDPRIITAIRAYGTESPSSARDFLTHLEHTNASHFLLQFADADPSAQAELGADALMTPSGFGFLTQAGSLTSAGSASGTSSVQTPPTLDELMNWDSGFAGAWPADNSVNDATLKLLHSSDITTVLLRSENVSGVDGTRITLPGYDSITGVVSNAALADAARTAISADNPITRDAARAQLAAELAQYAQKQSAGQVLAFDRAALAEAEAPNELIDWINTLAWVNPTSLDEQPQGNGTLISGNTSEPRLASLAAAGNRSDSIVAFAPLLKHPEFLDQYQHMRMLWAFGTRFAADDTAFAQEMIEQAEIDELYLRGVQVVNTVNTQLVGTSTQLPVQLHNSLPFDAFVSLRASPVSAAISVPEHQIGPTLVEAEGNSTVLVPVRSRVSSGESALFIQLTNASNTQDFTTATLPLTLRTSLEAILLSSLGAFAALLLGLGIWRSVKRRRSPRNNPAVG